MRNDGEEPPRADAVDAIYPEVPVYPDSDKIGAPTRPATDRLNFVRTDAVDYWEGE